MSLTLSMIWPVALIVVSNVFYHICTKSTPETLDPFASLIVTYLVGAVVSAVLYYTIGGRGNLLKECTKLKWTPFVLGIVIVGLEAGNIFAYKAGWQINSQAITQSAVLAVALIFVGFLLYKEVLTVSKIVGIVICLVGLYFINK